MIHRWFSVKILSALSANLLSFNHSNDSSAILMRTFLTILYAIVNCCATSVSRNEITFAVRQMMNQLKSWTIVYFDSSLLWFSSMLLPLPLLLLLFYVIFFSSFVVWSLFRVRLCIHKFFSLLHRNNERIVDFKCIMPSVCHAFEASSLRAQWINFDIPLKIFLHFNFHLRTIRNLNINTLSKWR